MEPRDFESLLRKYMALIVRHEGTNYLDSLDVAEHFTEAELDTMLQLASEPAPATRTLSARQE
jgi:hypothetical protein